MSYLILPRRFTQQPKGPVELDASSVYFPLFDGNVHSYLSGKLPVGQSLVGSAKLVNGGVDTGNAGYIALPNYTESLTFSLFAVFTLNSAITSASNRGLIANGNLGSPAPSGDTVLARWVGGSGALDYYQTSSVTGADFANARSSTTYWPANNVFVIGMQSNASGHYLWVNGVKQASSAARNAFASDQPWRLGTSASGSTPYYLDGVIHAFGHVNADISDSSFADIGANPWQLFRAKPRVLYFDVSTGGGASASLTITTDGSTVSSSAYVSPVSALSVSTADSAFSCSAYVSPVAALVTSTADTVPSSSAYVSPSASLSVSTESATFSGSAASGNGASISITTDAATFSGSASVSPVAAFTVSIDSSVFNGSASAGTGASLSIDTAAAVFSGSAYVAPIAGFEITTELAAFVGSASVAGTGTLDEATILAIAEAVWADPVAIAAHAKLDAIIARLTC